MTWIAVLVGGAVGSAARHGFNLAAARLWGNGPFTTAAVNIVGTLCIGLLAGSIASGRIAMGTTARAFVFVGLLGGFTTFSSYMLDTMTLMQSGAMGRALINLFGQIALGLAVVYLGFRWGQM